MNYAIKTLQNQHKLCSDLLEQKEKEYLHGEFEMVCEMDFFETDIANLKVQIADLENAISTLIWKK